MKVRRFKMNSATAATSQQYNPAKFPYPVQDLGPMSGTPDEIYKRALTIVSVFQKLCQLDSLELKADSHGYTDCATFVAANFEDPEAYLTVEHELSHIFFDSDLALGEQFRTLIIEDMFAKAGFKITAPEMAPYKQKLEEFIHHTWNCLEDHRVRSLWEEIFPGGGYFLEERWYNIAEHCLEAAAKTDLHGYMARTAGTNRDTLGAPAQFTQFFTDIVQAKNKVDKADNKTCLAVTKQLIDAIADGLHNWAVTNGVPAHSVVKQMLAPSTYDEDLLKHAKQVKLVPETATDVSSAIPARLEALSKIVQLVGATSSGGGNGNGQPSGPASIEAGGPQFNPMGGKDISPKPSKNQNRNTRVNASDVRRIKQIAKMAGKAQQGDEQAQADLEDMIKKGAEEMKRKIQLAKSELGKADGEVNEQEADKVEYLNAAAAAGIRAYVMQDPKELPKPSAGSYKVQAELEKIKMQRKLKRFEEGDDIDIEAFIDAKINKQLSTAKLFKYTTKESGMDLLILTDCSGSMYGNGIAMVDQAMADIEQAVKNLKVKTHLWGFSNDLYVFTKKGSMQGVGGGGTELIPALDTALEWARQSKASRGIIMLTDGYPTSCRNRNSTGNPRQDMYNVLTEAQQEGIVISILCINEHVGEYIQCTACNGSGAYAYPNKPGYCGNCNNTLHWENRQKEQYDTWFGANNYALVATKADIATQLPLAARALVLNHIKRH